MDSKTKYDIKQISIINENYGLLFRDGSFKLFSVKDTLIEIFEDKNAHL